MLQISISVIFQKHSQLHVNVNYRWHEITKFMCNMDSDTWQIDSWSDDLSVLWCGKNHWSNSYTVSKIYEYVHTYIYLWAYKCVCTHSMWGDLCASIQIIGTKCRECLVKLMCCFFMILYSTDIKEHLYSSICFKTLSKSVV